MSSTPGSPISVAVERIVCLKRSPVIKGYFSFKRAAVAVTFGAAKLEPKLIVLIPFMSPK